MGCMLLVSAFGIAGCASNINVDKKIDINNVANQVAGNSTDIESDLNGKETAVDVLVVEAGQVKNKPQSDASVIGSLAAGDYVTLLEKTSYSGYLKITYNGRVGYILKKCCRIENDSQQGEDETTTGASTDTTVAVQPTTSPSQAESQKPSPEQSESEKQSEPKEETESETEIESEPETETETETESETESEAESESEPETESESQSQPEEEL